MDVTCVHTGSNILPKHMTSTWKRDITKTIATEWEQIVTVMFSEADFSPSEVTNQNVEEKEKNDDDDTRYPTTVQFQISAPHSGPTSNLFSTTEFHEIPSTNQPVISCSTFKLTPVCQKKKKIS
ncbi:hypothetical protein CEXT_631921 [Caerostris extrusa]|uniref:Uncharacterized protein n=1 Tax=Caerostris extrusa TaxID=172846 RepID=A0AAV4T7M1_CAEEX|nr:hypothetical protein CEXT_631921 [Caerostris extrusa]